MCQTVSSCWTRKFLKKWEHSFLNYKVLNSLISCTISKYAIFTTLIYNRASGLECPNCRTIWLSNAKFEQNSIWFSNTESVLAKSTKGKNTDSKTYQTFFFFFYLKVTYIRYSDCSVNEICVFEIPVQRAWWIYWYFCFVSFLFFLSFLF